ncbi:short-chain dehydrogenase [Pseudomassariella vexata]|uniref:Short-chain dehydrogenase n=1 Tax=Pseudomassariella vexata TaxID=1141098 RepID=A0A1Y2DPX4_9PEZI|nr:short-chain dehydrogenase [Pseudomassariella vexata]ORY61351.1 short-chain dehydrogenase [Pseudomassariella vexata]
MASRTAFRLTRAAAPLLSTSRAGQKAIPAAARAFNSSSVRMKSDVVRETEVPVSVYAPDSKGGASSSDHFSIPVSRENAKPTPIPTAENEDVHPLNQKVFNTMTPTMQKMTVMDKVVIITGGARGLGNHMARACAEAGAKALIIFDANQELGDESAAELHQKTGLPVTFFKVDVRDGAAINAAVDSVVQLYGAPDVLVNSAGIADSNIKAETYDPAMFRRLIDINLTGSFLMSQAVGRAMMAAGKPGSIVLVASMSGSIVNYPQEQSCYNASKAGVIQFGKSLAAEWAKYNIRVNCISPGYMDTALNRVPALEAQKKIWKSMTPQNRLGAVDDLNGLCVFLASDSSAFMTGANVIIDGGYTCY